MSTTTRPNATTSPNAAAMSIEHLASAASRTIDVTASTAAPHDHEDARADSVLQLLRWIHSGGTFATANAAAAALERQTRRRLAAYTAGQADNGDDGTGDAGGDTEYLWLPAGPDPLDSVIVRERLRGTLREITRLPAPQQRALISDIVGEPTGAFENRTGWSSRRRRRTAARGRDTLRTAVAAAA